MKRHPHDQVRRGQGHVGVDQVQRAEGEVPGHQIGDVGRQPGHQDGEREAVCLKRAMEYAAGNPSTRPTPVASVAIISRWRRRPGSCLADDVEVVVQRR